MTALESYRQSALRIFGKILCCHANCRKWHYGVLLGESNANSLCNLIGMTLPEMMVLFLFLGLGSTMNYRGKKVFRINGNNFREFLESEKLGSSYFDRMKVGNVPGGVFGEVNTYKGLWLGVGHNDNGIVSNPSNQFQYFSRPPRINEKNIGNCDLS